MDINVSVAPFEKLSLLFKRYGTEHEETIQHSLRCAKSIVEFGSYLGLTKEEIFTLEQGALIHDAGKFYLCSNMLYSPRSLSRDEYTLIQTHPLLGDFWIEQPAIKAMKEQHHEYLDGSGYPYGLTGEAIHPYARMLTIVDVHDALSHPRSYKRAWTADEVRQEMYRYKGIRFDADLLDKFFVFLNERKAS